LDVTGTLNGGQGLRKEGVGLMRLGNSVHGYYGNTVVAEGTLRVLGTLPNSPRIEVAAGATIDFSPSYAFAATQTLAGNGSFTGDIAGAGNISPGASTGTLTVTGTADLTGSALNIEIDETQSPVSDVLAVSGALDLDGAILVVTVTGAPSQDSYIIATYGSLTGTFASHAGSPEGYEIDYTFNGNKAVAIKRGSSAYNVWAASFGLDPIGNGAPNADPDGDNLDNLLEYSLFSSPTDSHSRPAISVAVDGTAISLTYRRSKVAAEVSFIPEWSTNLVDWFTTGMTDLPTGAEDANTTEYRASIAKDGAAGKFIRVRVNRP
jgi:autotransporter-associated beta strand protein